MIERIEGYRGKVLPVVARPGVGQESVALEIAIEFIRCYDRSVLIFNPIENGRDVRMKLVCLGDMYPDHDAKNVSMEHHEKNDPSIESQDSQIVIDSTRDLSDAYIYDRAREISDLGLIVVLDYDFISKDVSVKTLLKVAEGLDIAVVVSALVSRRVERRRDKRPGRKDIKSAELRMIDNVILLYREGYYLLDDEKHDVILYIDRSSKIESLELKYEPHTFVIYDPSGKNEKH